MRVLIVVVLAPWAVPLGAQTAPPAKPAQASGNAQDLSSQATDPTAALMSLNFLDDVKVSHWGNDEGGFEFEFKPVVPFAAWESKHPPGRRAVSDRGPWRGRPEGRLDFRFHHPAV